MKKISLPDDHIFVLKMAYTSFLDTLNMKDYFYYLKLRQAFIEDALYEQKQVQVQQDEGMTM